MKLRCSGQRSGCDRCKATSSACVYSDSGDGRGTRRRKRPEAQDYRQGASAPSRSNGQSSSETTTNSASPKGMNSRDQSEMGTLDENMRDAGGDKVTKNALNSPLRTFDEDLLLSDQMLHDIMPGCGSPSGLDDFATQQDFSFFDLPMAAESDSRSLFSPTAVSTHFGSQTDLRNHTSCMHHASTTDNLHYLTLDCFQIKSTLPGKLRPRRRVIRIKFCHHLLLQLSTYPRSSQRLRHRQVGKKSTEHKVDDQGHPHRAWRLRDCPITHRTSVHVYRRWSSF